MSCYCFGFDTINVREKSMCVWWQLVVKSTRPGLPDAKMLFLFVGQYYLFSGFSLIFICFGLFWKLFFLERNGFLVTTNNSNSKNRIQSELFASSHSSAAWINNGISSLRYKLCSSPCVTFKISLARFKLCKACFGWPLNSWILPTFMWSNPSNGLKSPLYFLCVDRETRRKHV